MYEYLNSKPTDTYYRIPRLLKRWMIVPTKLDSWTGFILGPVGSHDLQDGWIRGNPGLAWLVNKQDVKTYCMESWSWIYIQH
jgi:hypothetical protein